MNLGIIGGLRAIRNGVGRPYGGMAGHHPYDTSRNYYYCRPYNHVHYRDHQEHATSTGIGSTEMPYATDTFEETYQEALRSLQSNDRRHLEYSPFGSEVESVIAPNVEPAESFFPQSPRENIRFGEPTDSPAMDIPVLESTDVEEDSVTTPFNFDTPNVEFNPLPAEIPDNPIDPAEVDTIRPIRAEESIESPVPSAPSVRSADSIQEDPSIQRLIDRLLPSGAAE